MGTELQGYLARLQGFPRDAKLFLVGSILGGFSGSIQGLYFNLYLRSLGYEQGFMGVMASLPAFVTLGLALPFGLVAGRIGYRRALLSGMALQGLALLAFVFLPARPWLLGAGLLGGIGGTLGGVVGAPFLAEAARDEERTHLFGVQAGLGVLAGTLGSVVGGFLPRLFSSVFGLPLEGAVTYRAVLLVTFALFLGAAVPMILLRGGGRREPPRLGEVLAHREVVLRLVAIQGTIGLGAGLVIPFVNIFFKLKFGVADSTLGFLFAMNSLLIGVGSFAAPVIARRVGRARTVVWPQGLSLPFLLLWGYGHTFGLAALGYLVRTPLMNLAGPVFSVLVMELLPAHLRSGLNGILMLSWNGGWALGALASGYVQAHFGFAPLFLATAGLYAVAVYLTHRCFSRLR